MAYRSTNLTPSFPFQAGEWWIDEKGGFHSAYGIDESLDGLFFRHLDQVRIAVNSPKIVVKWDVKEVLGEALPAVLDRLSQCRSNITIHLYFFYFGWVQEQYTSPSDAIERINQIQSFRNVDIIHSTCIQAHDLAKVRAGTPLIRRGYQLWEKSNGHFDKISNHKFVRFMPHVLIFRPDVSDGHLVFSHIGSRSTAARVYGRGWAVNALYQGSDSTLAPLNRKYDSQVCAFYENVYDTGEPRFDHVRALMHLDGIEPFWISYERLLTRSIRHDGMPAVVCLVNRTQKLSIPLAGGP